MSLDDKLSELQASLTHFSPNDKDEIIENYVIGEIFRRLLRSPKISSSTHKLPQSVEDEFEELVSECNSNNSTEVRHEIKDLLEELRNAAICPDQYARQTVVFAGHFNAGKSTFINFLLNEKKLLPRDTDPTTAIATYVIPDCKKSYVWQDTASIPQAHQLEEEDFKALAYSKFDIRQITTVRRLFDLLMNNIKVRIPLDKWQNLLFVDTPGIGASDNGAIDLEITRTALRKADHVFWIINERNLDDLALIKSLLPEKGIDVYAVCTHMENADEKQRKSAEQYIRKIFPHSLCDVIFSKDEYARLVFDEINQLQKHTDFIARFNALAEQINANASEDERFICRSRTGKICKRLKEELLPFLKGLGINEAPDYDTAFTYQVDHSDMAFPQKGYIVENREFLPNVIRSYIKTEDSSVLISDLSIPKGTEVNLKYSYSCANSHIFNFVQTPEVKTSASTECKGCLETLENWQRFALICCLGNYLKEENAVKKTLLNDAETEFCIPRNEAERFFNEIKDHYDDGSFCGKFDQYSQSTRFFAYCYLIKKIHLALSFDNEEKLDVIVGSKDKEVKQYLLSAPFTDQDIHEAEVLHELNRSKISDEKKKKILDAFIPPWQYKKLINSTIPESSSNGSIRYLEISEEIVWKEKAKICNMIFRFLPGGSLILDAESEFKHCRFIAAEKNEQNNKYEDHLLYSNTSEICKFSNCGFDGMGYRGALKGKNVVFHNCVFHNLNSKFCVEVKGSGSLRAWDCEFRKCKGGKYVFESEAENLKGTVTFKDCQAGTDVCKIGKELPQNINIEETVNEKA